MYITKFSNGEVQVRAKPTMHTKSSIHSDNIGYINDLSRKFPT
jgi:hypothetical protein